MTYAHRARVRALLLEWTAGGPRYVKALDVAEAAGLSHHQAAHALRQIHEHPDGVRLSPWNGGARNRKTWLAERA